jgi:MinD-like ATPase involved in chromosome partitioning or flagellar assembly
VIEAGGPSPRVFYVCSARPDGSSTVAIGLGAVAAIDRRVVVIDRNLERPEQATLLDLDESPNLHDLAYGARLAPVNPDDIEASVQWRDGVGVLPGIADPSQADEITDHFLHALLASAAVRFDQVIVDLGGPPSRLPSLEVESVHLWVVSPSPLGLAALDKSLRRLEASGATWWRGAAVALNKVARLSFRDVDRVLERRYGMHVVGELPWAADYWRTVEATHSVRALSVPLPDGRRYKRTYGAEALSTREALQTLASNLSRATRHASTALMEA